tara:strand:- start:8421 stop:8570 length:150 start_codon:yes stop_codon:yes gene_type:complete
MKNTILFDKIKGCLYGGAIGDALGAPAEWHYPDKKREANFSKLTGALIK